jgi:hypothetical protein
MPKILSDTEARQVKDDMGTRKPSKRGARRRGKNLGQSMSSFWQKDTADRIILHEISKVGRGRG